MKRTLVISTILIAACAAARGQVVPAAVAGPARFDYSLHYAHSVDWGQDIGTTQNILASGTVSYLNGSARAPFVLNYAGGYEWTIAGVPYDSGLFQRLAVLQGLQWRQLRIRVTDSVSYIPQAPISTFSGVPGTGEPVGTPPTGPSADQSVLTVQTRAVSNYVAVSASERLHLGTNIFGSFSSGLLRYPDGNGLTINSESETGGVTQILNVRTSLSGSVAYGRFSYPDYSFTFDSVSMFFGLRRQWNRKFSSDVSGGPQWASSNQTTLVPPSTSFGVNADTRYHFKSITASVLYGRGVSSGAGYLLGAHTDAVNLNLSRSLGRGSSLGVTGSWYRIATLNNTGAIESKAGTVQASRRFGRALAGFISYTARDQQSSAAVPTNVLSHLLQTISMGVSYSPRAERIMR